METILIWLGSGFAFAVGLAFGAFLMRVVLRDRGKESANQELFEKRADRQTELMQVNANLLSERNDIGREMIATMDGIFNRLDDILSRMKKDGK